MAGEQCQWEDKGESFPAVVAALLGAGANVRARDQYGETALHLATAAGDLHVMALLLAAGGWLQPAAAAAGELSWHDAPRMARARARAGSGLQSCLRA